MKNKKFKNYNRKIKLKEKHLFQTFLFLLEIVFVNLITIQKIRIINNFNSQIHLVIQGRGTKKLLYNRFNPEPSEVYVNGDIKNDCKKECYLEGDKNNVTLIFNQQIESCEKMFYNLNDIIEMDFSGFDFSKVISMERMFYQCTNLEKVIFGNVNTSSVTNMMCLFFFCSKLEYIELSSLNTSEVTNMQSVFYHCSKLKYLDLSNFNTSKVRRIQYMFNGCSSLIFLNLYSFIIKSNVEKYCSFDGISPYVKYCINDFETKNYLLGNNKISNCSDICFKKNVEVDINNNVCIETCTNDNYKYKYNDKCYIKCPK